MIYELKPGEYEIARPIFKGLRYNLAIFSVIKGNTPGSVYVDDVADPKTAFVWDKSRDSGFYLEGYARNAEFNTSLNRLILERLYPEARTLPGVLDLTLHYFPETWEDQFGVVLKDTNPMKNWQVLRLPPAPGRLEKYGSPWFRPATRRRGAPGQDRSDERRSACPLGTGFLEFG